MFAVTKNGDKIPKKVKEFILDTFDDIQYLPTQTQEGTQVGKDTVSNGCCSTGSSAFVIATSQLFLLDSDGIWREV